MPVLPSVPRRRAASRVASGPTRVMVGQTKASARPPSRDRWFLPNQAWANSTRDSNGLVCTTLGMREVAQGELVGVVQVDAQLARRLDQQAAGARVADIEHEVDLDGAAARPLGVADQLDRREVHGIGQQAEEGEIARGRFLRLLLDVAVDLLERGARMQFAEQLLQPLRSSSSGAAASDWRAAAGASANKRARRSRPWATARDRRGPRPRRSGRCRRPARRGSGCPARRDSPRRSAPRDRPRARAPSRPGPRGTGCWAAPAGTAPAPTCRGRAPARPWR